MAGEHCRGREAQFQARLTLAAGQRGFVLTVGDNLRQIH